MELFDRKIHDFGEVGFNTTHTTTFTWLGEGELGQNSFSVPCGCTKPTYDKERKELKVHLKMNTKGDKKSSVTIRTPKNGVVTLLLKAKVI